MTVLNFEIVPPLAPSTVVERQRFAAAELRRELRREVTERHEAIKAHRD